MVTPSRKTLERAIRGWIAEGSEIESKYVIQGNSPGPAPTGLYSTVLAIRAEQVGTDSQFNTFIAEENYVKATIIASKSAVYSVQFFRKGAYDAASRFRVWASSPLGRDDAVGRGLTFQQCTDLRQLDSIISSTWEERAGLDLHLDFVQTLEQNLGLIESAPFSVFFNEGPEISVSIDGSS